MKAIGILILLFVCFNVISQGTFEEGWEVGYKDAMADGNKAVFIVPIAPIVMANESDTYRSGYQRGYNKGLEKLGAESDVRVQRGTVIIDNGNVEEGTFDEGWKLGYSDAMDDGNKAVFIVPITPIVMANESNTYRSGYQRGYNKGVEDLND